VSSECLIAVILPDGCLLLWGGHGNETEEVGEEMGASAVRARHAQSNTQRQLVLRPGDARKSRLAAAATNGQSTVGFMA